MIPAAQSCNPATLGDKDMGWLEESSLVTLLVSWIHTHVDFKSSWECGTAMTLTVTQSLHRNHGHPICPFSKNKQLVASQIGVIFIKFATELLQL